MNEGVATLPPEAPSAWERSATRKVVSAGLPGVLVAAVIILQFLVPFVALTASVPPTRFGFQMYSGMGSVLAQQTDANGLTSDIDVTAVSVKFRPELDWSDLPERLCAISPDATRVKVTTFDNADPHVRTVTCKR
jgi:hypothetical protein